MSLLYFCQQCSASVNSALLLSTVIYLCQQCSISLNSALFISNCCSISNNIALFLSNHCSIFLSKCCSINANIAIYLFYRCSIPVIDVPLPDYRSTYVIVLDGPLEQPVAEEFLTILGEFILLRFAGKHRTADRLQRNILYNLFSWYMYSLYIDRKSQFLSSTLLRKPPLFLIYPFFLFSHILSYLFFLTGRLQ